MRMNIVLAVLLLILCSMNPITPNTNRVADCNVDYATVSLKYSGTVAGFSNLSITVKVDMDTSVGFRYEIIYQGPVNSHAAIFYKFSDPSQLIFFNFTTHHSKVIKYSGPSKDPVVSVGKNMEVVNGYSCTHLYHENETQRQDYYMSTSVPGFSQVARILNDVDPSIKIMVINHTVFNYGGLVKLSMTTTIPNPERTVMGIVNLVSAQSGIPLPRDDFDVPAK